VGLEHQSRDLRLISEMQNTFPASGLIIYGGFMKLITENFLLFSFVYM